MRVLLDTNVVLDVLLRREPWLAEAEARLHANDAGRLTAFQTATTLTDIYSIARRLAGLERARQAVQVCLEAFEIAPVTREALERAHQLAGPDFEDNLQMACAELAALDALVTRDEARLPGSPLPVWSPAECLKRLALVE